MSVFAAAIQRLGSPVLGFLIPALIFLVSFALTYGLYRRFSRSLTTQDDQDAGGHNSPSGSAEKETR